MDIYLFIYRNNSTYHIIKQNAYTSIATCKHDTISLDSNNSIHYIIMPDWLDTYVINLDRDSTRMKQMHMMLKRYAIKYTRMPAIYGRSLTADQINHVTTFVSRNLLCSYAMIGCALSHINTYRVISNTGLKKWYLILEDDAIFTPNITSFLERFRQSPIYAMDNMYINLSMRKSFGRVVFDNSDTFMQSFVYPVFPSNNTAYLITHDVATKLANYYRTHRIFYHIDVQNYLACDRLDVEYIGYKDESLIDFTLADAESNIGETHSMTSRILRIMGFNTAIFYLSGPVLTVGLKYSVNGYTILFAIVFLLNHFVIHSNIILLYLLIELVLLFISLAR